jgi:hypothetical protein
MILSPGDMDAVFLAPRLYIISIVLQTYAARAGKVKQSELSQHPASTRRGMDNHT